jgi:hypothetical protein
LPGLTPGTAHSVSGSGEIAVSAPAGLRVQVASPPVGIGKLLTDPQTFIDLGHIAVGTALGWMPISRVLHLDELFLNLPHDVTRVGYSLANGSTALITELVADATVIEVSSRGTGLTWAQMDKLALTFDEWDRLSAS